MFKLASHFPFIFSFQSVRPFFPEEKNQNLVTHGNETVNLKKMKRK